MSMNRLLVACQIGLAISSFALVDPAAAQPEAAAWSGLSRQDATAYELPGNWIDLATGGIPPIPPDATSAVSFGPEAGQAPRDPLGETHRPPKAGQDDLGARLLGHPSHGVGDRVIGQHAGDEDLLAVEEHRRGLYRPPEPLPC